MAMGLALALPGKLDLAAEALELLNQKDKAGQRLMLMMAKPRRPRKDEDPTRVVTGLTTKIDCSASVNIASKMLRLSANYMHSCSR